MGHGVRSTEHEKRFVRVRLLPIQKLQRVTHRKLNPYASEVTGYACVSNRSDAKIAANGDAETNGEGDDFDCQRFHLPDVCCAGRKTKARSPVNARRLPLER